MNIVADVPLKCRASERRAELVRAMPSAADIMKLPNAADIMKRGYMHILTQRHVFMISEIF